MQKNIQLESKRLRASWEKHDIDHLDWYLVSDQEDPRINLQSILTRSFIIDTVFRGVFTALIREEFRFSICLNFFLKLLKNTSNKMCRVAIFEALENHHDMCGNLNTTTLCRHS